MAKISIHTVTINEGENGSYITSVYASLDAEKLLRQVKKAARNWRVEDDEEDDAAWTQSKYTRAVGACKTLEELVDLFTDVHAPFYDDSEPCMEYKVIKD